jgi:hypothetical protein
MWGEIENIIDRALKLDEVTAWFQVIDREMQWEIIRLNTIDQLEREGLKADGSYLPDYSKTSVEIYGKEEGHIKLKQTGKFYRSFVVKVDPKGVEIIADTKKGTTSNDDLAVRYGIDILGLTDENNNVIVDALTNKYIEYLENEVLRGN